MDSSSSNDYTPQKLEDAPFPISCSDEDVFPGDSWRWALEPAQSVWEILARNGGSMQSKDLMNTIAIRFGRGAEQAMDVFKNGVYMLKTFDLISVERRPVQGKARMEPGRIAIIRTRIDRDRMARKKSDRWFSHLTPPKQDLPIKSAQKPAGEDTSGSTENATALRVGKIQIDSLFRRSECPQDDATLISLLEDILAAFGLAGVGRDVQKALWTHAFEAYDRICRERDPGTSREENDQRMREYLKNKAVP